MSKVFEDEFMEIQSEMVSLCLEYLEKERKKGKKIYIYCNNENNTMMFHAFFHIGDEIWSLGHRRFFKYDHLSDQVFDIGMELMRDIEKICQKHNRPVPTESKLTYNCKTGEFTSEYKYGPTYSKIEHGLPDHIFRAWADEERQKLQNNNEPEDISLKGVRDRLLKFIKG